jgi:hypothetical protein
MPSASLSGSSTLLTPLGWFLACELPTDTAALGADRHGLLVARQVRLTRAATKGRCAFVGTESAFGCFSCDTRLIAGDGAVHDISELIEERQIRDVSFETHVEFPGDPAAVDPVRSIWSTLCEHSPVSSPVAVALKRRDAGWAPSTPATFLVERSFGGQAYCVVHKDAFAGHARHDWAAGLLELGEWWLFVGGDDMHLDVERSSFLFALWYGAALRAKGRSARFRYDSLQLEKPGLPLERGRTAFLAPALGAGASTVQVEWEDRSWTPLSSGFLVAAG